MIMREEVMGGGDGSIPTNKCFLIAQKISVRPAPPSKCKWVSSGCKARCARYTDRASPLRVIPNDGATRSVLAADNYGE